LYQAASRTIQKNAITVIQKGGGGKGFVALKRDVRSILTIFKIIATPSVKNFKHSNAVKPV